jgi:hypothetical protein
VPVVLKRFEINLETEVDFETPATPLGIARFATLLFANNMSKRFKV